jgi:LacI family transcriptional regulator
MHYYKVTGYINYREILMMVTIRQVAKKAGVSCATISRVINDSDTVKPKTREHVIRIIKEMGYAPNEVARSLSKNETKTIGVVVPDINNPFFGDVIKGVSLIADKNNLNILLCDTNEDPEKEKNSLRMLKDHRIRGIIICPASDTNEFNGEYLSLLENLGIPIVLVGRDVKYSNFDGVFMDNVQGASDGVMALIQNGHKKIAIISGPEDSKPGRDRLGGYLKAISMGGLAFREDYIFRGSFKLESGYELTRQILQMEDRPTAIFTCNNMMTLGCIKALSEQGLKIPQDMALVGFDEIELLEIFNMQITVIARPTFEMGRIALELLLERFGKLDNQRGATKRITLTAELKCKGSERLTEKNDTNN